MTGTRAPAGERLQRRLVVNDAGCHVWTGAVDRKGYGRIKVSGTVTATHRLAWGLAHPDEPLPPAVRHYVCDNPPCCNPEHLRPGTNAENMADRNAKGRTFNGRSAITHCPANHAYDEANTLVDSRGGRGCRACRNAAKVRKYDPVARRNRHLLSKATAA